MHIASLPSVLHIFWPMEPPGPQPKKQYVVESLLQSSFGRTHTEAAKKDDAVPVVATLWMDDFKPNYSKNNRGSVWIVLLTLECPSTDKITASNVYPIAVGPKGTNHQEILSFIFDDFKMRDAQSSQTLYYNGATKSSDRVNCKVHVLIPDQPERRSINGLLSGGHGYHGHFGWSFDIKSKQ